MTREIYKTVFKLSLWVVLCRLIFSIANSICNTVKYAKGGGVPRQQQVNLYFPVPY